MEHPHGCLTVESVDAPSLCYSCHLWGDWHNLKYRFGGQVTILDPWADIRRLERRDVLPVLVIGVFVPKQRLISLFGQKFVEFVPFNATGRIQAQAKLEYNFATGIGFLARQ